MLCAGWLLRSMAVDSPHLGELFVIYSYCSYLGTYCLNRGDKLRVKDSRYQGFLLFSSELGERVSFCLFLISLSQGFCYQLGMGGNIKLFPGRIEFHTLGKNFGDGVQGCTRIKGRESVRHQGSINEERCLSHHTVARDVLHKIIALAWTS